MQLVLQDSVACCLTEVKSPCAVLAASASEARGNKYSFATEQKQVVSVWGELERHIVTIQLWQILNDAKQPYKC